MAESPYRAVIFDCDSTLTHIEGVDELAKLRGVGERVSALTEAAMDGMVPVEEVYARRLELIRPDRDSLEWLGRRYVQSLVDGAVEVVRILFGLGKEVHVVSGGFLQAVRVIAGALALPEYNIHAVNIYLDEDGAYSGFESGSPLSRSGGKAELCRALMARYGKTVAIGDGVTDLEMKQAGAAFIGFGGVAKRVPVMTQADHYIDSPSLSAVLPFILTAEEQKQLRASSVCALSRCS